MARWLDVIARRTGLPLTRTARRTFRYLAQYYPPLYYGGFLEKLIGFDIALRHVARYGIQGDVVECGLGRGLTFFALAHIMHQRSVPGRLYGFDSFAGFPEPTAHDQSVRRPEAGDIWADTSARHVLEHFATPALQQFLKTRVTLVPGFFADTLRDRPAPAQVALLNLDVDLYESYRDCLQHLGPRVTGLIVYDEYASPKWPGATRAIDEQLPRISHTLYRSGVLTRFVSLPDAIVDTAFAGALRSSLDLETVGRG